MVILYCYSNSYMLSILYWPTVSYTSNISDYHGFCENYGEMFYTEKLADGILGSLQIIIA